MRVKIVRMVDAKLEKILGGPIRVLVTPETVGSRNIVVVYGLFEPGEGLVSHKHPFSEEVYYVVRGSGTVYAGKEKREVPVEAGMSLYIPPGEEHFVRNTGTDKLEIAFFLSPGTEKAEETGA